MVRLLLTLALLILACTWFVLLRPTTLAGPAGYIIVSGTSMEPTLYSGDLVIVQQRSNYQQGDVVAFRVPADETGGSRLVIHRILGGDGVSGYVVQGDNKEAPDSWTPTADQVIGKQWIHIPGLGSIVSTLNNPIVAGLFIAGLTFFLVLDTQPVRESSRRAAARPVLFRSPPVTRLK